MKNKLFKVLKNISTIIGAFFLLFFVVGLFIWGIDFQPIEYDQNYSVTDTNLHDEGPFVFDQDSVYEINYVKGEREEGFSLEQTFQSKGAPIPLKSHYYVDGTSFEFILKDRLENEPYQYDQVEKIIAISDIESNYKALRDFLISNQVIDENLEWIFGKGHLVLNGDFIDRGYFATQVLWFIYKLEHEAERMGGKVHFVLGNHEIMNIEGNHKYAKSKYENVSRVLGLKQYQLYDNTTYLGQWLSTKNVIEQIGPYTFVHAGISPEFVKNNISISEINRIARDNYSKAYYAKKGRDLKEKMILSSQTSPYWYRGYFKDDLDQEEIESVLRFYSTSNIIVGHTILDDVERLHGGKIIGIDVVHPKDEYKYFPKVESQGLLIENDQFFQINSKGERTEI